MAGRAKSKKDNKSIGDELPAALANFTLPHSLPSSEVQFPVLIRERTKVKWKDIIDESDKWHQELDNYSQKKKPPVLKSPFLKTEVNYIKTKLFVYLMPALEETLNKAKIWNAFKYPKCFFNGIDHIAQVLWNNNPRDPSRKTDNLHLFNMPWVREYLKHNPRPYYPKSWLWTEDYAATLIQKTVKQYFIQKDDEVQEMREFWKKLELERTHDVTTNPFLAKMFASMSNVSKKKNNK